MASFTEAVLEVLVAAGTVLVVVVAAGVLVGEVTTGAAAGARPSASHSMKSAAMPPRTMRRLREEVVMGVVYPTRDGPGAASLPERHPLAWRAVQAVALTRPERLMEGVEVRERHVHAEARRGVGIGE